MIYDILAPFYDRFMGDVDYTKWADFAEKCINKYMDTRPELGLDLGCGTGKLTAMLSSRGYDMTGVDYSPEMLNIARENAACDNTGADILWLCQDMTAFELYGTVDFAVCSFDGINHLTSPKMLDKCLSLVHNYLIPDGIFIFDINGRGKFERVYSDRSYVFEEEGSLCTWQNYYNEKQGLCDFYISVFAEEDDGRYVRYDEVQRERMYTLRAIKAHLAKADMEFLGAFSDTDFTPADDTNERIYIAARCKK